jgi:hypothetical protein
LEYEVVGQPAEDDHAGAGDCAESEDDVFGVVLGDLADGAFGEGRLLVVVLGLPVDDDEAEDRADGADLVEEEGGEGASEHDYIIIGSCRRLFILGWF